MFALLRRLTTLAAAAEFARRYARNNPEQAGRYLDQAAGFVDKQTKGKYSDQIKGVTDKAKGVAGIRRTGPGARPNGQAPGYGQQSGLPVDPQRRPGT